MDILEMLANELKDKHFNELEKMRYIYLRTCQIFSYNYMYYYCSLLSNSKQRKEKIKNEQPNITNIESSLVTCKSYSVYILKKLLRELITNLDVESVSNGDKSHYYVAVHSDKDYVLDGVLYDLTRVKMNMSTKGFITVYDTYIQNDTKKLKQVDLEIGYIKDDYEDNNINCFKNKMPSMPVNEAFKDVSQKLETASLIKEYSDATNMIELLTAPIIDNVYSEAYINDDMIVKLYLVKDNEKNFFHVLRNQESKYKLENVDKKEFMSYVKKLKSQRYQITKYL